MKRKEKTGVTESRLSKDANEPKQLPESVWQGPLAEYRELVKDTTEAPDAYHYLVAITIIGVMLGRRVHTLYGGGSLYSNIFGVAIGDSGITRKTTAWKRGEDLLNLVFSKENDGIIWSKSDEEKQAKPEYTQVPGIGSAEGLLDALDGVRRIVLVTENELATILSKAKQSGTSTLIPKLTSLFDCPTLDGLKVKTKNVVVKEPFISILTASTPEWLSKHLQDQDIAGGFANRFVFVWGDPKNPNPYPPAVDEMKQKTLADKLGAIRSWAEEYGKSESGGFIAASKDAEEAFEPLYYAQIEKERETSLHAKLIRRIPSYVWKIALVNAAIDKSTTIELKHIQPAIDAVPFFEWSVQRTFEEFGISHTAKIEKRFLAFLDRAGGEAIRRNIYRNLGISAAECNIVVDNLKKAGEVEVNGKIVCLAA